MLFCERGFHQKGSPMQVNQADRRESPGRSLRRRRSYLINPYFQWKYALTAGTVVFLAATIIGTVLYGVLHQQARLRAMNPETYTTDVGTVILGFALAFAVLAGGAVCFWAVRVTHRICGPLAVLDGYLAELAAGRIPRVRDLRRKDEFKHLHQSFRAAMNTLSEEKQIRVDRLAEAIRLAEGLLPEVSGEARNVATKLLGQIDALRAVESRGLEVTSDSDDSGRNAPLADTEASDQSLRTARRESSCSVTDTAQ
jgi:methyl-accepting chemotaxis protein